MKTTPPSTQAQAPLRLSPLILVLDIIAWWLLAIGIMWFVYDFSLLSLVIPGYQAHVLDAGIALGLGIPLVIWTNLRIWRELCEINSRGKNEEPRQ
jgi:hypothetical protein